MYAIRSYYAGVGSEVALGCGVIGVAAEHRTPIRITHMTAEYSYGRAMRESAERAGLGASLETAIVITSYSIHYTKLYDRLNANWHLFLVSREFLHFYTFLCRANLPWVRESPEQRKTLKIV